MQRARTIVGLAAIFLGLSAAWADEPAAAAARQKTLSAQIEQATQALAANPKDKGALALRAALHAALEEHALAIADYDQLLSLDPDRADAYDLRGSQQFMLGKIKESIDDFDRYLKLRPEQEPWHWKRGISYYYAGRYDEGRRQFEGYQTVDDNDVENAVWRYLCMARGVGAPAAREAMLKIKRDTRVPMMEVYALYRGEARPEEVLAAARAGSPSPEMLNAQEFYAHLYLGLYYEVAGQSALAKEHLVAARRHKVGHYMWNVADVHLERLKAAAEKQ